MNIVLVGHSIGAYIAFAAAKRAGLAAGRIGNTRARAIGLMPYLENNELPELKAKVKAVTRWWSPVLFLVLSVVAGLIGSLPVPLKSRLFRRFGEDSSRFTPEMVALTIGAIPRFSTLRNILALFRTEAEHLAPLYDYSVLNQGLDGKLALLYSGGDSDIWAPSSSAARAAKHGVAVTVEEGLPHAFSVGLEARERVVQLMCTMLQAMPTA
jgi:pimeloyl-ACP methyl ester carboxylesterase